MKRRRRVDRCRPPRHCSWRGYAPTKATTRPLTATYCGAGAVFPASHVAASKIPPAWAGIAGEPNARSPGSSDTDVRPSATNATAITSQPSYQSPPDLPATRNSPHETPSRSDAADTGQEPANRLKLGRTTLLRKTPACFVKLHIDVYPDSFVNTVQIIAVSEHQPMSYQGQRSCDRLVGARRRCSGAETSRLASRGRTCWFHVFDMVNLSRWSA